MNPATESAGARHPGRTRRTLVVAAAVNAAFLALVVAWAVWYGCRQRRKLKQARALLEQLENETVEME